MRLALLRCMLAGGALAAQIPVEQEPDHHAAFHNQALYLLEPRFPPGHTTLEHLHRYDGLSVCIQGSVMRSKSPGGEWGVARLLCQPGGISINEYTGKASSHTVQNAGEQTTHLRLIENLREGGWTTFPPVAADGLKVIKESRAFRAYEVEFGNAAHIHPVPTVVVLISGQASTGGEKLDRGGAPIYIRAGQTHVVTGAGGVVEIEVR
jgi:hypothetical protein